MAGPAAWLLGGAVIGRLALLLATLALSRILSPSVLGEVTLVQTAVALAAGIGGLGLGVSVTRRVAQSLSLAPDRSGRYLGWTLWVTGWASLAVTIVYMACAPALAPAILRSPHATASILVSAGAVPATALLTATQGGLMGLQGFRRTGVSQGAQGLGPAVGTIVGAILDRGLGALAGLSLGTAIAAAVSAWLLWREAAAAGTPLARRAASAERHAMWGVARAALLAFLVLYVALLGGQLLLARTAGGYAQVALFNIAYRWHLGLMFIPAAIAPVVLPMMSHLRSSGEADDARALFILNVLLALVLTVVPVALIIVLARPALSLSGGFYERHSLSLVILAVAAIPGSLNNVLSGAGISLGAVKAWMVSDVALAGAFFATAAALVPSSGAAGLSWAYLAGYTATDAALVLPLRARLSRVKSRAISWE